MNNDKAHISLLHRINSSLTHALINSLMLSKLKYRRYCIHLNQILEFLHSCFHAVPCKCRYLVPAFRKPQLFRIYMAKMVFHWLRHMHSLPYQAVMDVRKGSQSLYDISHLLQRGTIQYVHLARKVQCPRNSILVQTQ